MSVTSKRNRFRLIRSRLTGGVLLGMMTFLILGIVFFPAVGKVSVQESGATQTVDQKVKAQLADIREQVGDTVQVSITVGGGEDLSELPQVVTSDDSAIEQIRDETVIPNASPSFKLNADITKIDSTGHATTSRVSLSFTQLAFVEDTTAIDFSEGFIEIRMEVEGQENVNAILTGDFDVLIDDRKIITEQFNLKLAQIRTDSQGKSTVLFIDPIGNQDSLFTFSFEDNLNRFPDGQLTEIRFEINNLRLQSNLDEFALDQGEVFSMTINHDSSQTVIINERGEPSLISLKDDTITISALPKSIGNDCIPNPAFGDVFLSTVSNPNDRVKIFSAVGTGQRDDTPTCFNQLPTVSITDIARNTGYLIQFTDPATTIEISTPNSQKDYNYSCQYSDVTKTLRVCNFG